MRASRNAIIVAAVVAIVGILISGAIAGYAGRGRTPLSPGLDGTRATALNVAARRIQTSGADAAEFLDSFRAGEPGNALNHYLLAAAYARRGGWAAATAAMQDGNRAPHCLNYADPLPFVRDRTAVSIVRTLREEFEDAALSRPGAEAGKALHEGRTMATRIARAEPPSLYALEAGVSLRHGIAQATGNLAQKAGEDWRTDLARQEEKADAVFLRKVRAERQALFDTGGALHPDRLREKYGLTEADAAALAAGEPLPDADRRTQEAIAAEWDAAERAAVSRLLSQMPD